MAMQMLGVPEISLSHPGIDRIGSDCRIAASVTVLRFNRYNSEQGIFLGDRVSLYEGVRLVLGNPSPEQHRDTNLRIGNDVIVNAFCYLSGEGGLTIDDEVLIGSHAKLLSAGHDIDGADPSIWRNPLSFGAIHIGRGAWIAAGACILQGIRIGEGAVIGAASVVTRNIPAFAIAAGNPAKIIRYRKGFAPKRRWSRFRLRP